jgi:hypothetical protein
MNTKMFTIAALLAATLLTGFLSTPMAYAGGDDDYNGGDISETNTEQELGQSNIGDSDSVNFNCGQQLINSPNIDQFCDNVETGDGTDGGGDGGDPTVECETCIAAFVAALGTTVDPAITAALGLFSCDGFTEAEVDALILSLEAIPLIDLALVADLEACLDLILAAV